MVRRVMVTGTFRKLFAVLLAVLVTAGLSWSVAPMTDMAGVMPMATEMAAAGHRDCHACDVDLSGKVKLAACAVVCTPALASMPQTIAIPGQDVGIAFARPDDDLRRGARPPPDRTPPRPFELG